MKHFWFVFLLFSCFLAYPKQDTLVLQDLKHAWIAVEENGELAIFSESDPSNLIIFEVPEVKDNEILLIRSQEPVDIWINDQLLLHQFDSVWTIKAKETAGTAIRIFCKRAIDPELLVTQILQIKDLPEYELLRITENKKSNLAGYFLVLTIILLLTGVYKRVFPITFSQASQNPLRYKIRSFNVEKSYVGFGTVDNFYSVLFFGALASLLFGYLDMGFELPENATVKSTLTQWLGGTMIVSLVIFGKFFWARLIAFIYQLKGISNIQVQDFVHFSTFVFLIGVGMSLIDFSLFGSVVPHIKNLITYLLIISVLFFQGWLFFKFDKFYSHRKLMIFSYLCTTEFLPGFLIIYWLTKM